MPMLPGCGGRLGRLAFFGWSVVLAFALTLFVFVLLVNLVPHDHSPIDPKAGSGAVLAVTLVVTPVFLYGTLMLQARRFRDIGWSPLLVIGGWFVIDLIDIIVAHVVPSLALRGGHNTLFGTLVNLLLFGCLLFWPGEPEDRRWGGDYHEPETPRPVRQRQVPVDAPAPVARPVATQPAGFGRRTA